MKEDGDILMNHYKKINRIKDSNNGENKKSSNNLYYLLIPLIVIGLIAGVYAGLSTYDNSNISNEREYVPPSDYNPSVNSDLKNNSSTHIYSASSDPKDEATCKEIINPDADTECYKLFTEIDKDGSMSISENEFIDYYGNSKDYNKYCKVAINSMIYHDFKHFYYKTTHTGDDCSYWC